MKRKSARNKNYWIALGFSEIDAIFEAKKRMPGQYEYFRYWKNQSHDEALKSVELHRKKHRVTLNNMIELYGEIAGTRKFNEYREKQAYSNTLEFMVKKYGKKEGTKKYYTANKKRAVTKKNQIKKYGVQEGTRRWNKYVERQRYTTSLDYFKEKHGEVIGQEKWDRFVFLRSHSFESYLDRAGGDITKALEGYRRFILKVSGNQLKRNNFKASPISQELFLKIEFALDKDKYKNIYFERKNHEWVFLVKGHGPILPDFFVKDNGKVIEFYGDFWHASPHKYGPSDILKFSKDTAKLAKNIWAHDQNRIQKMKTVPYVTDVLIVWEHEYKNNKRDIINKCLNFITNDENRNL